MPIDTSALLYDPVYAVIGVPATLDAVTITVIDDTKPVTNRGGDGVVRSVGPGAFARIPELNAKGVIRDSYMDATLIFNGRTWTVRSYELIGDPNGEEAGEVRFLLKAADVG